MDIDRIVYFDGECNLCNAAVDFLIRRDPIGRLKFAPLQGVTAARRLPPAYRREGGETFESMVYQEGGRLWRSSSAALRSAIALGGAYRAAWIFLLIPIPIRDSIYLWIARNRYRWFGKRSTCRLPSPSERARFLP